MMDDIKKQLAEMTAERDLLQDILDSRPAINAGLPQTYIAWSQGVYAAEAYRAVHGHYTKPTDPTQGEG